MFSLYIFIYLYIYIFFLYIYIYIYIYIYMYIYTECVWGSLYVILCFNTHKFVFFLSDFLKRCQLHLIKFVCTYIFYSFTLFSPTHQLSLGINLCSFSKLSSYSYQGPKPDQILLQREFLPTFLLLQIFYKKLMHFLLLKCVFFFLSQT